MFGYTIEDVPTGKEWFKKAYPDKAYRRKVMKSWLGDLAYAQSQNTRQAVFTVTCKNGSLKEICFRPVNLKNRDQLVIYEDITERTIMENQLQQSQNSRPSEHSPAALPTISTTC